MLTSRHAERGGAARTVSSGAGNRHAGPSGGREVGRHVSTWHCGPPAPASDASWSRALTPEGLPRGLLGISLPLAEPEPLGKGRNGPLPGLREMPPEVRVR